jgi:hypothetical protein
MLILRRKISILLIEGPVFVQIESLFVPAQILYVQYFLNKSEWR